MSLYSKQCPKCGCKQTYARLANLNRAIIANTICRKCNQIEHNRWLNTLTFEKECMDCKEKYIGKYKNLRCPKCDRIMRTKWKVDTFERILRKNMNELQISSKDLMFFGRPFLLVNTDILDICQLKEKINKVVNKNYYGNNNQKNKLKK